MIHPTAIVSPRAEIGSNVAIGPYAIIGENVIIHDEVEIAGHVVIEGPSVIGRATRLYPFAYVGQAPQDLKYRGEMTRLEVGERNTIREYVTMHRGTAGGGGLTRVGDDNLFMAQAHIAHDCIVGSHNVFANAASLAGHVEVADHTTLGAFVGVHQFCRVGSYAFIGAFSKIVQDPLPFAKTDGQKAKCYGANTIGLRRKGMSSEVVRQLDRAFFLLLQSGLNTTQAVERIKAEIEGVSEVDYLISFIESSRRGVIK